MLEKCEFEYLGPYHIEGILGRGGMGTVYKGRHAKSGEPVAIKVIAPGVADQLRFRRRFSAEVETLKRLRHPNIVQLVGWGEEHGLLFYSMEFVEGHSLHDHLRQHRHMPWAEVIEVGIEVAAALKHAHDQGIIHRDLKPANLMLTKDGSVKLTDFGIAKLFGSTDMTAAGSVIGTADFMPPEQAEGKPVTVRSDIYSLGSVMFALLAGRAPFAGKSVPEVLYSVRYSPPPDVSMFAPAAPDELKELIAETLNKDPLKRPPTALVVGNRLKAIQQGVAKLEAEREQSASPIVRPMLSDQAVAKELTSIDLNDEKDDDLRATGASPTQERPTAVASDSLLENLARGPVEHTQAPSAASSLSVEIPIKPQGTLTSHLPSSDNPLPSSVSHYTAVSPEDARTFTLGSSVTETSQSGDWIHYASIAGLVALLLGAIGFSVYMLQPESADTLYTEISEAVESGDDARLLAASEHLDEFANRFPNDERTTEVKQWIDEVQLLRMSRLIERRAAKDGVDQLSAIDQGFLSCMRAMRRDPQEAQAKLSAFMAVFGNASDLSPQDKRTLELANHAVKNLQSTKRNVTPPATAELERTIRNAEKTLPKERLPAFYRGLIELYGDKPWAKDLIVRARGLAEQKATESQKVESSTAPSK